jgi:glutamate synthase domain-containing protein 3
MVDLEEVGPDDAERLQALVEEHGQRTGSPRASALLERWEEALPLFRKVMPRDYARALGEVTAKEVEQTRPATDNGTTAVTVTASRRGGAA